jgi:hypothetical protein
MLALKIIQLLALLLLGFVQEAFPIDDGNLYTLYATNKVKRKTSNGVQLEANLAKMAEIHA